MNPIYHVEDCNAPFCKEITGTMTFLEEPPADIASHGIDTLSIEIVSRHEKVPFSNGFGIINSYIDDNDVFKLHFECGEYNNNSCIHRKEFTKDFCQNISEVVMWCIYDKVTLEDLSVDITSLTFTFSDGTNIFVNPDMLISRNNSYLYEKYYN